MRELKLKAVGSSPFIAEEIKSVVQSFLGEKIFIDTDDEVSFDLPDNWCWCRISASVASYMCPTSIIESQRFQKKIDQGLQHETSYS